MTVYAMFVTFVLGGITSIVALYSYLVWKDGKELKKQDTLYRENYAARQLDEAYRAEDQEQTAVDLVADKLGGKILSYETN